MKRLDRVRKLLGFLRLQRRRLLDDDFQAELATMYRDTGAGKPAVAPALMAMATFVQAYLGVSDAEMVELTVVDLRVQMVLDCLGASTPAFSQGALCDFRDRLIRSDLDRRLLERTVELARETGGFDARKLPRSLRLAVDSSPFDGGGPRGGYVQSLGARGPQAGAVCGASAAVAADDRGRARRH